VGEICATAKPEAISKSAKITEGGVIASGDLGEKI